jgi:hypothetical protein
VAGNSPSQGVLISTSSAPQVSGEGVKCANCRVGRTRFGRWEEENGKRRESSAFLTHVYLLLQPIILSSLKSAGNGLLVPIGQARQSVSASEAVNGVVVEGGDAVEKIAKVGWGGVSLLL